MKVAHPSRERSTLALSIILLSLTPGAWAATWFVDIDNTENVEDGTTWATAFTTIQPGIDAAFGDGGGEVWVAEGIYAEVRTSPNADGSGLDYRFGCHEVRCPHLRWVYR